MDIVYRMNKSLTNEEVDIFTKRISNVRGCTVIVKLIKNEKDFIGYQIRRDLVYIVTNKKLYDTIISFIDENHQSSFFVELFCPIDIDIVPLHERMEDISEISQYAAYIFPRILFNDPIVKWYGWTCDSYIKITRSNNQLYYRHLYCTLKCEHREKYTYEI